MGNQSSKEKSPTSPVANHSSSSNPSTTNARREKEHRGPTSHNNGTKSSHLEKHSASASPSQRYQHQDSMGNDQSKQTPQDESKKEKFRATSRATPVKVPRGADPRRQRGPDSQFESSGPSKDPNFVPHSNLNFPPRMPLPIEEEFHAPYSPTIAAQEFSSSLHEEDFDGAIPRQSSVISNTTLEEEELGNELQPYPYDAQPQGLVPTRLQWMQGGDRVYVTGTFAGWNRKFRMGRE